MAIFEPAVMKQILGVTCSILKKNFYYEDESLSFFLNEFTANLGQELTDFEMFANESVVADLHNDKMARFYFTCYFVSAHLREFFIHRLHFSEQELNAFESVLPKYTGERYEKQQPKHQGTYNRKFFK
ncbi:MAG TPA: hypothetical protein VLI92_00800 [Candidatus Saccharimonadales bacterium]|nr:hypothetical protein [Candidatus Saccharimonadales bacterium]